MPRSEERELKFDVQPKFVVPDVGPLLPPGGRTETTTEQLRSEYFDTVDHALLRARMTLRRRTGSTDNGWQLKVPTKSFREEIRVDGVSDGIPDELGGLLLGIGRGQQLTHIASVSTERAVTRLVAADGSTMAEIDDDTVHASANGESATITTWREVEVELGGDELELLYVLGKRMRKAGARPSASSSKLARALLTPNGTRPRTAKRNAGDVIAAYLVEQQQAVLAGDLALRRGDDTVIHKTRVATRRLRSTLRVFAPLLDAERAARLDDEVRWYAGLLGQVRDQQVLRARLATMLDELDDAMLMGPIRTRLNSELRRKQSRHWRALQHELTQPRYLAMLADIDDWVRHPAFTDKAASKVAIIQTLLERAERKVSKRLQRANSTGDIHLLHGARKAAKRARYAAEAAKPVIGGKAAKQQAKRYQRLQDLLGEHQDSLVSADVLRRLGAEAGSANRANGFAFGILYEREQENARRARALAQQTAKRYT